MLRCALLNLPQGSDTIYGAGGNDDIYGGHHIRHGQDEGDVIHGGEGADAVLGDNGEILRERVSMESGYPWVIGATWRTYPSPFESEVIRDIRRYDDIDFIFGNDGKNVMTFCSYELEEKQ